MNNEEEKFNKEYYISLIEKDIPTIQIIEMAYFEGYDDGWEDCLWDGDDISERE